MTRVAAISHETAQVIGLLSAVMREEDGKTITRPEPSLPLAPAGTPTIGHPESPAWFASLNFKYQAIAGRIVAKPSWTRTDFQHLAAEFQLMPLGVFDAINEWADEHLGDFLLEGEDPVTVNTFILPK